MKDFFISYNKADRKWAEWIAWILEEAGYHVFIQAWDFRPGGNFVLAMHQAAAETEKTIAVLSDNYLNAEYTQPEWAVAFAKDARGENRSLVPMKVSECMPTGLLTAVNYVNLIGLSEDDARVAVLGAFSARAKPTKAPPFPVGKSTKSTSKKTKKPKPYPGKASHGERGRIASALIEAGMDKRSRQTGQTRFASGNLSTASAGERLKLAQTLSAIQPQQFNIIVFALNPPPGLIPPMPAPQMERSHYLLAWAESPSGCGIDELHKVMQQVSGLRSLPPQPGDVVLPLLQPISVARVAEVNSILCAVSLSESLLKQSYYASSPLVTPLPEEHRRGAQGTLSFCLERLAKMACRIPDSAPLLEFVERLAPHIKDGAVHARLAGWVTQVAHELEINADLIRVKVSGQVDAGTADAGEDPYLLIKVEQSHWDANQFEVKAWLLYADEYYPLRSCEGTHTFAGLPELMGKLIDESQEHLLSLVGDSQETLAELVIEIFLPIGKLNCEAHRWDVGVGLGTTRPVGTLYRVAVRSFERTYHKAYRLYPRAVWRQKWQARPKTLGEMTDLQVCWACSDEDLRESLFDRLKKSGLIFVALTPILAGQSAAAPKVLQTVLDAGTAIALWPSQCPQDMPTAREDVRALVYNQKIDMMPRAIFAKRENTMVDRPEGSIWSFLTLMWDDPDRLPPDVKFPKLRAPS
jgi:TIR domain.